MLLNVPDRLLTARQICEEWQISPVTFYRYVKQGLIPPGEPAGLRSKRWRKSVIDASFAKMQDSK
ncbi:helix-turn-helix domain-containing protein [Agrobacterium sp. OT33]|uniref:helix-turn-helix transcriptional regulator n=1 Tax=Agrobacterium sp. OT33 TaxID=2815338 RepID=UPI001A90870B|nr:helix-turn-helix domain-containing protein [Agrobacterium sp. OT33]